MVHTVRASVPPQGPVRGSIRRRSPRPARGAPRGTSFRDVLRDAGRAQDVKFSAHAAERLRTRRIPVTGEQQRRLSAALDTAAGKGARESLVLIDEMALVVSVPNRTVITVARQADLADRVFTGIDSAVVLTAETNER